MGKRVGHHQNIAKSTKKKPKLYSRDAVKPMSRREFQPTNPHSALQPAPNPQPVHYESESVDQNEAAPPPEQVETAESVAGQQQQRLAWGGWRHRWRKLGLPCWGVCGFFFFSFRSLQVIIQSQAVQQRISKAIIITNNNYYY